MVKIISCQEMSQIIQRQREESEGTDKIGHELRIVPNAR